MQSLPIVVPRSCHTYAAAVEPGPSEADGRLALLHRLLDEQQQLTAVDAFAAAHERGIHPRRAERYRALLPAREPGPGQQYAFEVDLDRCSGCKACVAACHALNGLDEHETWRAVGLLTGGTTAAPVVQHVTTACHHCLQPACMTACPVNAYTKDPVTGIVKHLDDQCFGCQYCTLACPYDVPQYHRQKGIVRKCDMCAGRLAIGEAPACVQSCPHEAIAIRIVDRQQVLEDAEAASFLPAAPDAQITLPTTTYKTRRVLPRNLLPADYYSVNPQHAHLPLVIMLVLTQLSVGAFVTGLVLEHLLPAESLTPIQPLLVVNGLGFGVLALSASLLHLGRPWLAFRAVLGMRHSWLSREIAAFGLFAGLAGAYTAAVVLLDSAGGALSEWLGWLVSASGLGALFCSVMIYAFTRRECWSLARVAIRFLLTAGLLGIAAVWLSVSLLTLVHPSPELHQLVNHCGPGICEVLVATCGAKLLWEAAILGHLLRRRVTPLKRSALLMTRQLSNVTLARFATGVLGGILVPGMMLATAFGPQAHCSPKFIILTAMLFAACLAGELLERYLFFAACAAPRMPGPIR